jgi:hypothetical protein
MPFEIGDNVVDIRNINNLYDSESKRRRSGVITAINSTIAYVNINGTIEEIPVEYLLYKRIIT